ncbi:MAG TPA: CPBP family intramembrane glutamic endopeptidase [Microlunatus sp.]|nr:CPBP family intramembrane glutamic endopeptidase [Microlunatus sp.]
MTEQHPVSSSGQQSGPPSQPPTYGPTAEPASAFPPPGPYGTTPPQYQTGPPPQPYQPGPAGPYPPGAGQPSPTVGYGQPYPPGQPVAAAYGPLGPPASRDPLPPPGTEYHRFLRTPRNAWWKGLVAIVGFVVGYLLITTVISVVAIGIDLATGRSSTESYTSGALELTPALFLATNIGNALAIPLAMFLQWLIWGQPVRWLHSVTGAIRWRLLGRVALVVVPIWIVYMLSTTLLTPQALGGGESGGLTTESIVMLIMVLLTTPLQAAGEEYGARGLIMRAAGSWIASPWPGLIVAIIVPSLLFTLAHGAGDPWLIAYYFVFGAAMSVVTWRTGGLEASTVVHTVNNMLAFGIVILSGQQVNIDRSAGTGGPFMLILMAVLVVVAAVLCLLAQRWEVQRRSQPAVTGSGSPAAVTPGTGGNPTH